MQFKSAFSAFAIMATILAGNAAVVSVDGTPNEGDIDAHIQNITSRAFPSPIEVSCSGSMDPTNTANAVIALEAWCNSGGIVPGGQHAYAVVGGVMAFVCSYGGNNPCNNIEYSWAQQAWEATCGTRWGSGYVWIPSWKKTYGQGVFTPNGVCTNGAGAGFRVN